MYIIVVLVCIGNNGRKRTDEKYDGKYLRLSSTFNEFFSCLWAGMKVPLLAMAV